MMYRERIQCTWNKISSRPTEEKNIFSRWCCVSLSPRVSSFFLLPLMSLCWETISTFFILPLVKKSLFLSSLFYPFPLFYSSSSPSLSSPSPDVSLAPKAPKAFVVKYKTICCLFFVLSSFFVESLILLLLFQEFYDVEIHGWFV